MLGVEDIRSLTTPVSKGHITGMGSLDEEISAMLQSNHTTFSQASLAEVMAPDLFSSPYPPHSGGGGLARTASVGLPNRSRPRPHPNSRNNNMRPQNQQPWNHVIGDAKWTLDSNGEVLDVFDSSGFGMMNAPPAAATAPSPGGLHRHHSAPSAFLQALADEAFSQIPPPPPSAAMEPLFSQGGLTPIIEVMDVDRMGSGNSANELEQFLSPDSDFSRRAAMSAMSVKPENAETFSSLFPATKSTGLLRQKSLPVAQQMKPKQVDAMEEQQISEESISGTSEDNSMVSGFIDTITSWPSSPTTSSGGGGGGGKRPRSAAVPASWDQSEISSGGLIRHLSLPTDNQDSETLNMVQMRARAKRGCATHPRSIAERVRRTRISERMKKLQDLVPNMEKTTNTSDMLDETVEYVKSLQLQVKELQQTIAQLNSQLSSKP